MDSSLDVHQIISYYITPWGDDIYIEKIDGKLYRTEVVRFGEDDALILQNEEKPISFPYLGPKNLPSLEIAIGRHI